MSLAKFKELLETFFDSSSSDEEADSASADTRTAAGLETIVKFLKDYPTVLQEKDKHGNTALSHVLQCPELVALLLDQGADPDQPFGQPEETALRQAIQWNNEPLVKLLLDKGANPNLTPACKETPLQYAFLCEHREHRREVPNLTLIRLLIHHPQLDINANWYYPGCTTTATTNALISSFMHFGIDSGTRWGEAFELLLRHPKINVNFIESEPYGEARKTALHYAIEYQDREKIRMLLEHPDIDPTIQDNKKTTALALLSGDEEFAELIKGRNRSFPRP